MVLELDLQLEDWDLDLKWQCSQENQLIFSECKFFFVDLDTKHDGDVKGQDGSAEISTDKNF